MRQGTRRAYQGTAGNMRHGAADRRGDRGSGGWEGAVELCSCRYQGGLCHHHGTDESGQGRGDAAPADAPSGTLRREQPSSSGRDEDVARQACSEGVRVKLPGGVTWAQLATMTPAGIRDKGMFPKGFLPLPHPHHAEGGMVFPTFHITEIKQQEERDLTRFDLDFDLPDHVLPEFPPPMFLTTRPDLGDVSQGKLVTIVNFYQLFNGILNPKQLEGLRLLVTPFPQQQFNQTEDRRTERPSRGVMCFECHVNGHTNAATHLVGDIRPQEFRWCSNYVVF